MNKVDIRGLPLEEGDEVCYSSKEYYQKGQLLTGVIVGFDKYVQVKLDFNSSIIVNKRPDTLLKLAKKKVNA